MAQKKNAGSRISDEKKRLLAQFAEIEDKKEQIVAGLVDRAAFMRVKLDEMEDDLKKNGFVELFQQSDKVDAYERKRPIAEVYQGMNNSYQKIIKQLTDLLPKEEPKPTGDGDGFDGFVNDREDD